MNTKKTIMVNDQSTHEVIAQIEKNFKHDPALRYDMLDHLWFFVSNHHDRGIAADVLSEISDAAYRALRDIKHV